jgi:hypothetical protein
VNRVRLVRWLFWAAGGYGLVALLPNYALERQIGEDYPPPITHPEYFYGFVGVAVAWQLAFLVMGTDPIRYRPLMLPAVVEKYSFAIAAIVLLWQGRIPGIVFGFSMVDLLLGSLFVWAYFATPSGNVPDAVAPSDG